MMKVIILLGPPGAGKGTQARLLARHLDAPVLGMGDLLRREVQENTSIGQRIKNVMEAGQFPDPEIVISVLKKELLAGAREGYVILDGVPRDIQQVPLVERVLKETGGTIEKVFLLDVPTEQLRERLQGRYSCIQCGQLYSFKDAADKVCEACGNTTFERRQDDKEDIIEKRLEIYRQTIKDLIEYYRAKSLLVIVNGGKPVESVFHTLLSAL